MSLINEEELNKRLNNPLNLINQMKKGLRPNDVRKNAMALFVRKDMEPPVNPIPEIKPIPQKEEEKERLGANDVIDDADTKIKLTLAHNQALALANKAIETLTNKLDDVKADNIPAVINAAGKLVENIRKERLERDKNFKNDQHVHHHFYMPEQKKITDYEVVEVS